MDVDMHENMEELSIFPSAVSDSAEWHEPKFLCDRQCMQGGFKFYEIAAILVEDDGKPHTRNLCMTCYTLRQVEKEHDQR